MVACVLFCGSLNIRDFVIHYSYSYQQRLISQVVNGQWIMCVAMWAS
jgi:hypothetical protein